MANIAGIYTEVTRGPTEKKKEESLANEALVFQAKVDWINSQETRKMIHELSTQYANHLDRALKLAEAYPQTKNHEQIIQVLTEANMLRKMLETYAKA